MKEDLTKSINEEFFNSLANSIMDIDGGDIGSNVWFCGIEPGGEFTEDEVNNYRHKINDGDHQQDNKFKEGFKIPFYDLPLSGFSFDRKIVKVIETWLNITQYKQSYGKNSAVFKLNLFPIRANNIQTWNKFQADFTGCNLKRTYYGECIKRRFPLLREITAFYKPKVIVCIGLHLIDEFITAFWGVDNFVSIRFPTRLKLKADSTIFEEIEYNKLHIHESNGVFKKYTVDKLEGFNEPDLDRWKDEIRIYKHENINLNLPMIIELPFITYKSNNFLVAVGNKIREEINN